MRKFAVLAFIGAVLAFAWLLLPPPQPLEQAAGGHASHAGDPAALTDGVVVSVDRSAGNVTISHGPIRNLGMSSMTMGFQVADRALLGSVKPGDKVRFHVDIVGGTFTVMSMEPAN